MAANTEKDQLAGLKADLALLRGELMAHRKDMKRNSTQGTPSSGLSPRKRRRHMVQTGSSRREVSYVVVTGGVMSGLGKGITASSVGRMLKDCGWSVTAIKIDPYVNCDAGTMSPFEHGECFVLDDGGETDLDLGNYERFIDINLTRENSITTGNVYKSVIDKERRGDFLGKTVQVIPHITGEILRRIRKAAETPVNKAQSKPDVCIIELGGTIGDIESMPFIEALRQLRQEHGSMCIIHVSLVPTPNGEQKTKPTQHSVKLLSTYGLAADFIACRCDSPIEQSTKEKIGHFCNIPPQHVLSLHNVSDIWKVPLLLHEQGMHRMLTDQLGLYLPHGKPDLREWRALVDTLEHSTERTAIAIVGKYTVGVSDTYLSVCRALKHASVQCKRRLEIVWVNSSDLVRAEGPEREKAWRDVKTSDGILVPGGFGARGIDGKVAACEYARKSKKPFLGICLGFQVAVIEAARNLLSLPKASSTEFEKNTLDPVVMFMPEGSTTTMGGTMRLGLRRTVWHVPAWDKGTAAGNGQTASATAATLPPKMSMMQLLHGGSKCIDERHRHRYEVNPAYIERLDKVGLHFVGKDETGKRMEVLELERRHHPFFVGVQFHPELKSRPARPSPSFTGLLLAASGQLEDFIKTRGPIVAAESLS